MVTQEMLANAMRKAVAIGIFPAWSDTETYLKYWERLREVLEAAQQGEPPKRIWVRRKGTDLYDVVER
jgi:hypothetical protein